MSELTPKQKERQKKAAKKIACELSCAIVELTRKRAEIERGFTDPAWCGSVQRANSDLRETMKNELQSALYAMVAELTALGALPFCK